MHVYNFEIKYKKNRAHLSIYHFDNYFFLNKVEE